MILSLDDSERRGSVALIDAATRTPWTYAKLCSEVELRRDLLASLGRRGLVFHFCSNDLSSVAWYLGAIEASAPIVLLSGQLKEELRAGLITLYHPEWIISDEKPGNDGYRPGISDGVWQRTAPSETPLHPELALLLSTSGSTGSPKLVRLTRDNITANASSIRGCLGIGPDHFPVAHLPLHYSYGLSVINSHLLAGASILLTNQGLMTADFWHAIRDYQANSFSGVPYTYEMLRRLDLDKVNAPSLRTFTQAGGKLDTENISYFHDRVTRRGGTLWIMYGQTEATARIAVLPAHELPRKLGSVGKSIPGGRLSIQAENSEITTAGGAVGELVYEGPNVMMGYARNREDLTIGDELRGRLCTGDRASFDDEGFVYILGRSTRDAKLFGLRVNLDELEAFVKRSGPAAAVSADERVVIFCEFGNEEYLQRLRKDLSTTMRIHGSAFQFRRIDQLPTKASGKVDYERLKDLL